MDNIDKDYQYNAEYKFSVRGLDGHEIGKANSFGECKRIHTENLPEELKEHYAGLDCGGNYLKSGRAYPCFYETLPDELAAKHGITLEKEGD